MSGLHQTGEHERERKRAKKVNKQREKDKRGGTANNWPSTFQFAHSTELTLLFGATFIATKFCQ